MPVTPSNGWRHALTFRAIVATVGHFSIEMNPLFLTVEEKAELSAWIALHKRLRPLLHGSSYHYRSRPEEGRCVHAVASEDDEHLIMMVAQAVQMLREQPKSVRVPNAAPGKQWRGARLNTSNPEFICISQSQLDLLEGTRPFSGASLAVAGFPLPPAHPESADVLEFEAVIHSNVLSDSAQVRGTLPQNAPASATLKLQPVSNKTV